MNVILDSTDLDRDQTMGPGDAANIRPDPIFDIRRDPSLPTFCTENYVIEQC